MERSNAPDLPEQVWTGRKPREGLWVTDIELIERLGLPREVGRRVLHSFDADPRVGFPKKQAFFGGRRYFPACKAFLDKRYGNGLLSP